MATNKKKTQKIDEFEMANKYAPKNPAKSRLGKSIIVILCAGMIILPLVALIIALCTRG